MTPLRHVARRSGVAMHLEATLQHSYGQLWCWCRDPDRNVPAPVVEYITPAPAARSTLAAMNEYVAPVLFRLPGTTRATHPVH